MQQLQLARPLKRIWSADCRWRWHFAIGTHRSQHSHLPFEGQRP